MSVKSLHELFLHELGDMYSAEKQITEALPKMVKATEDADLKAAFEEHLQQTEGHMERLDQVFQELGEKRKVQPCEAMKGIVKEGSQVMQEVKEPSVRDAALIGAAQKVEHYEIASYGTLVAMAKQMGHKKAASLLEQTLEEEKQTDARLTKLALKAVNREAGQAA